VVAVILRLKVRLLWAGVKRGSAWQTVTVVLGWLTAVGVGGFAGLGLIGLRAASPDSRQVVLVAGSVMLALGWLVASIVLAGADGTLDADLLLPFPLRRREMAAGVLGSAALGPGGLFTVLVVAGAVAGTAPLGPGAILSVAAGAVVVGQCLATTRLATTALSRAARTGRGRNVALFVVPLTGFLVNIGVNVLGRSLSRSQGPPAWVRTATRFASLTPPGLAGRSMDLAAGGRLAWALAALVGGALWLALLLRLWVGAIDRLQTTAPSSAGGARSVGLDLFGGALRLLPRSRLGAVAAKELRLQWRDPRQRIGLFGLLAGPLAVVAIQGVNTRSGLAPVFLASLPATTIATAAANLWGYDGKRYWVQVAAPDDPRADLYGKVLARVITMTCITASLLAIGTLLIGRPGLYASGLAFAVAGGGLVLGVAVPFSIITPVPLPEEAKNLFASGRGGGSVAQILPTFLIIGLATVVLFPLGYLTAHYVDRPVVLSLVGLLQVGVGLGAGTVGLRLALRRLRHREPELLAALTRG